DVGGAGGGILPAVAGYTAGDRPGDCRAQGCAGSLAAIAARFRLTLRFARPANYAAVPAVNPTIIHAGLVVVRATGVNVADRSAQSPPPQRGSSGRRRSGSPRTGTGLPTGGRSCRYWPWSGSGHRRGSGSTSAASPDQCPAEPPAGRRCSD